MYFCEMYPPCVSSKLCKFFFGMVSNCSRCQIVRSVKLSVFTHGVKLSLCQIVRCQIVHGLSKNALFTVRLTLRVDTLQPPVYGQLFVRKKFKGSIRPRIMIIYNIKLILTTKRIYHDLFVSKGGIRKRPVFVFFDLTFH